MENMSSMISDKFSMLDDTINRKLNEKFHQKLWNSEYTNEINIINNNILKLEDFTKELYESFNM